MGMEMLTKRHNTAYQQITDKKKSEINNIT